MITAIFAIARNGVIGKDNDIPWRLPSDFKHFKETTLGWDVIMGRKTWDSLPCKPLPNRTNFIVSRTMEQSDHKDVEVVGSLEDALAICNGVEARINGFLAENGVPKVLINVFIIGGSTIYTEALEKGLVDRLIVTEIDADVEGDTYFHYDKSQWRETERVEVRTDNLPYDIVTYMRDR